MTPELRQKRDSILHKIRENPETIILYRKAMTDDGFGGYVENPFGAETETVLTVRIFRKESTVQTTERNPAGYGSSLSRAILSFHDAPIYEGECFEAMGKRWRIGVVDQIKANGGIAGYQASLYEAENVPTEEYGST